MSETNTRLENLVKYPPGSEVAIANFCECAIYDNHHGKGIYDDFKTFVINANCPIHGESEPSGLFDKETSIF